MKALNPEKDWSFDGPDLVQDDDGPDQIDGFHVVLIREIPESEGVSHDW